jgi:Protein of unknown function (DUF3179)
MRDLATFLLFLILAASA